MFFDSNTLYLTVAYGLQTLVYVAGLIAAFLFWDRQPKVALMVVTALLLMLLLLIGNVDWNLWMTNRSAYGPLGQSFFTFHRVYSFASAVLRPGAVGLLVVAAVFTGRGATARTVSDESRRPETASIFLPRLRFCVSSITRSIVSPGR